ncbi:adenosine kinase [Candidatus Woesearchaeota archaeon]|nr:adenosine kinase [Candidatus Woesearchaeota archaeon]
MKKEYGLIALGNPIVDYTAQIDPSFLKELGLTKGVMTLIDGAQQGRIEELLKESIRKSPGGSPGNVVCGVAHLGSKTAYCGSVGIDENAKLLIKDLERRGIENLLIRKEESTGVAIALITPDKERTFAVNIGASSKLSRLDLSIEKLRQTKYLHTSGYELESLGDVVTGAMAETKKAKGIISFDLADSKLITRNLKNINDVLKNYVGILFANEDEAEALTSKKPEEAIRELSTKCGIAVVKLGKKGAIIQQKDEQHFIEPFEVTVCNTNGAGDAFAAGFLSGMINGYGLKSCGILGSYYASRVVEKEAAQLNPEEKIDLGKILKKQTK